MSREFLSQILLPTDPVTAMEAATKKYVDEHTEIAANSLDATAPLTDWPVGMSFMAVSAFALTWPHQYGVVETIRSGSAATVDHNRQIFSAMDGGAPHIWTRRWVPGVTAWSSWAAVTADTGWKVPAYQSSWVRYNSALWELQYRRVGQTVYVQGLAEGTAATSNLVFTLPTGYRPTHRVINMSLANDNVTVKRAHVIEDGQVHNYGRAAWQSFDFTFYTADAWPF